MLGWGGRHYSLEVEWRVRGDGDGAQMVTPETTPEKPVAARREEGVKGTAPAGGGERACS